MATVFSYEAKNSFVPDFIPLEKIRPLAIRRGTATSVSRNNEIYFADRRLTGPQNRRFLSNARQSDVPQLEGVSAKRRQQIPPRRSNMQRRQIGKAEARIHQAGRSQQALAGSNDRVIHL